MSEVPDEADEVVPELMQWANDLFTSLEQSIYSRMRCAGPPAPVGVLNGHETAIVPLPGEAPLNVEIDVSNDGLRMEFDRLPLDLKPASVALFTPVTETTETVVWAANGVTVEQAPDTGGAVVLGFDSDPRELWSTEAVIGPQDLEVRLQEAPSSRAVLLTYRLPEGVQPDDGLGFRLRWRDPDGGEARENRGKLDFEQPRAGWREGEIPLGFHVDDVHRAQEFEVRLETRAHDEDDCLTAEEFREIVGPDHQVLILKATPGALRPTFEGRFVNQHERRLWSERAAWRMVRFEPTPSDQGG